MALVTVRRSPSTASNTSSNTSSAGVSEADSGENERRTQPRSISESFLTVKGAALFLPCGNGSSPSPPPRRSKHTDLQQHLQSMFTLLRPEDTMRLAVRLESASLQCTRYMVVVSTNGRQDTEESVVLGIDFSPSDGSCTIGLVLPLWSDTLIHLDGDGGFSVSTISRVHIFKPVSVQAMWSALQSLHKACDVARCCNYYPGSLYLTWVSYYQSRVSSEQACVNEWSTMPHVESHRTHSPVLFTHAPSEGERTERQLRARLREIMMQKDLENITSKEIRTELEMQMGCNLREFKEFIDKEMIVILGQMESPTEIFDHVYLGTEWNASNLEELLHRGVRFILNVTREIDNFFPGMFEYHNIRVYDEEATDLLAYWNDTYKFISKARKTGAKCLVHCKMGVSRSASTVIAYAMKEYGWDLERAFEHVKGRRTVAKPNPSFMRQLEEYQGILLASKQRHNKLWRSHSDGNLCERPVNTPVKAVRSLGRSDPHNPSSAAPPSLQQFLENTCMRAHSGQPRSPASPCVAETTATVQGQPVQMCPTGPTSLQSPCQPLSKAVPLRVPSVSVPINPSLTSCESLSVLGTSSPLSTDSIDFFSAREKFLGLSQENQASHTPDPRGSVRESPQADDTVTSLHHNLSPPGNNDINQEGSRRHYQPDPQYRSHASSVPAPSHTETDDCFRQRGLFGSVRRATRKLEQRLKAEQNGPLTSSTSPCQAEDEQTLHLPGVTQTEDSYSSLCSSDVRQKAMEIEMRIRQVGLTPPSQMKRSASLAKLGCLELISEWPRSPAHTEPVPLWNTERHHTSSDDATKKLRVPPCSIPAVAMVTTRQQHGRSHPVRRLCRRISSSIYNTM